MTSVSLDAFLQPRGIAILGASGDPAKLGYAVARNLVQSGYQGHIHLVNPRGGRLFDLPLYQKLENVPDPLDLAVVIVPAPAAPEAMREVGQRGIRAAILTSGGFRETGPEGARLEEEVIAICQKYAIRLVGPNCVGMMDTHLPFDTTFLAPPMPRPGGIAFLSHSGAFCAAVIDWSRGQGFGFSTLVSLGNQADLNETDLLPIIAADQHTKTICLYLETISNGRRFIETTQRISREKPIVVLKVGRTSAGQRAAASHTGAMAGSDQALNAALAKTGVLRAASAEQLFDWAQALATYPPLQGKNIAILTSAGGPGVIASDALESSGLVLANLPADCEARIQALLPAAASAHNPVDMLASASPSQYADCLEILLGEAAVDGVLVITLPPPSHRAEDIADALISLIKAASKPVLIAQMGGANTVIAHEHFVNVGIPVYPFPERAASALGVLQQRAIFLAQAPASLEPLPHPAKTDLPNTPEELVAHYGIATTPLRLAQSANQAATLAAGMGFPLVAKIASPDILHKSDIGGVLLNLGSIEEIKNGYAQLIERAKSARPDARLDGITLQRQVGPGQEVILGALRDPQFGAMIMFGSGGVEAEGLKDVAFALAPLHRSEAENLLAQTWAGRKLDGYRSIAPADKNAVIEALLSLSNLAVDHDEITEIEINPLRVLSHGAIALDIRWNLSGSI